MADTKQDNSVVELQARWDKIRIANLYDTLDKMGYPNQCLDLGIRPLFPRQHLAGQVITARGSRVPRVEKKENEEPDKEATTNYFMVLHQTVYPGSVVVLETGGERRCGACLRKWSARSGMSSARSRSDGMWIGKRLMRK